MRYVKWIFYLVIFAIVAGFLHYNLPQRDIVRIVNTYEERQDFSGGWNSIFWGSGDSGAGTVTANRDVLFIQTVKANGAPMVYRNEDTSWGWPPYFKFDTANLQTRAADAISSSDEPRWVAVRHYGWRSTLFSIFPNALSMTPVAGPDVMLIPWFNIIFLLILLAIVWSIVVRVRRWKGANIDPVIENVGDTFEDVGDSIGKTRGRFGRWLDSWKPKDRR